MRTSDVETFLLESERNVSERRKNASMIVSNAAIELTKKPLERVDFESGNNRSRCLLPSFYLGFNALLSVPRFETLSK